jgi:hypothetical protein
MMLIDPPTPFADQAEWKEFLKEMEVARENASDPDDVRQIEEMIKLASDHLN